MATTTLTPATRLPGPPELLPGRPDAVIDLQTEDGVALVHGQWRYSDAHVEEIDFDTDADIIGITGFVIHKRSDRWGPDDAPVLRREFTNARIGIFRFVGPPDTPGAVGR